MEWLLLMVWIREHVPAGGRGRDTRVGTRRLAGAASGFAPRVPSALSNKPLGDGEK